MLRRSVPGSLVLLTAGLLASSPAQAKDLRQRLGVGANAHLGSVPALSIRYGLPTGNPAVNIQVEAAAGFWIQDSMPSQVTAGGRVLYGVVAEDNMNLFLGAGAAADTVGTQVNARVQPVMGADFFFFGLENLGFTAEWGLDIDVGANSGFATTGTIGAGVHYWF
ncbi:MAG: hypothetical protein H6742_02940 [Alphaproteobacteria bacterium]|nr:hypothetical protein [Alphaproteobacteria bacterium]